MLDEFEASFDKYSYENTCCPVNTIETMPSVTLHAGAGGTESCDWCKYAVSYVLPVGQTAKGFEVEVLDYLGR